MTGAVIWLNFGFNLVFKHDKYLELLQVAQETQPFEIKMEDIYNLDNVDIMQKVQGYKVILEHIRDGLESFIDFSGIPRDVFANFDLRGPTIEGVGLYPIINENLKIPNEDIYVVGDCTGIFRGIIASMLSGIFVADLIANN